MLSGSETAITSIPKQKVHQLDDTRKNNRIKRAKENIEKTIGGILVGNNFVNIVAIALPALSPNLLTKIKVEIKYVIIV